MPPRINPDKLGDDLREFCRRFRGLSGVTFTAWVSSEAELPPRLGKRRAHVFAPDSRNEEWRTLVDLRATLYGVEIQINVDGRPSTPEEIRREGGFCAGRAPSRPARTTGRALVRLEDDQLPFGLPFDPAEEDGSDAEERAELEDVAARERLPATPAPRPALPKSQPVAPRLPETSPQAVLSPREAPALALPARRPEPAEVLDVEFREVGYIRQEPAPDEVAPADLDQARREATANYRRAVQGGEDPAQARERLDFQLRVLQPSSPSAPPRKPASAPIPRGGQATLPLARSESAR